MRKCISRDTYDGETKTTISALGILIHMRNALSHYRIVLQGDKHCGSNNLIEIKNILFFDKGRRNYKNGEFEMTISLTLLKEFVDEIFNTIINNKEKLLNKGSAVK